MDPFRCLECGQVKITTPHNDWGRTCFGLPKPDEVEPIEDLPVFKTSESVLTSVMTGFSESKS